MASIYRKQGENWCMCKRLDIYTSHVPKEQVADMLEAYLINPEFPEWLKGRNRRLFREGFELELRDFQKTIKAYYI